MRSNRLHLQSGTIRAVALVATALFVIPAAAFEEDLLTVVERLAGKDNPSRAEATSDVLEELGFEVLSQEVEHAIEGEVHRGRNLIVEQPGGNGNLPRIVVGAHFDAAAIKGGGLSRGAVDNAAGTSIVVHLAQRMRRQHLRHDVHFVLFDMEERGFVGSRHYVEQLAHDEVSAMINVDIATSGEAIIYGPRSSPGNEVLYEIADRLCRDRGATCLDFPHYPPSDERSFQQAGIPNISFAVIPEVEAHQLWLRFNAGSESGLADGFLPKTARLIHTEDDSEEEVDEGALAILLDHLEAVLLEVDRRFDSPPGSNGTVR